MDKPTKAGLMQFLDTAVEKGWINRNTGVSWKTAATRALETLGEQDDLTDVDVRAAVLQFNNRNPGAMSPSSLRAYEHRATQGIRQYLQYRADPMAYRAPMASRPAKIPNTAIRSGTKKVHDQPLSPSPLLSSTPAIGSDKPVQGQATDSSLALPFPMRHGFLAQIVIPRDMTKAEASRLCAFIQTLAHDTPLGKD